MPSTINGLPVTRIGDMRSFVARPCMGMLTIPASVTSIGSKAFWFCTGLGCDIHSMVMHRKLIALGHLAVVYLTIYYHSGATGFTTPAWAGVRSYRIATASTPSNSPISLNITSPSSVEYTNDTSVTVDWTITDTASTVNNVEISDDNGGTWTNVTHDASYTFNGLSDGQYVILVNATDDAGNEASACAFLIVDTVPPTVTSSTPSSQRHINVSEHNGLVL